MAVSQLYQGIPEKYPGTSVIVSRAIEDVEARQWEWLGKYRDKVIFEWGFLFFRVKLTVGDFVDFLRSMLADEEPREIRI